MKLKNIRLPLDEKDKRLSSRKSYLVKIDGRWFAGKFEKEWYGWNFFGMTWYDSGYQVSCTPDGKSGDDWQKVYEINQ